MLSFFAPSGFPLCSLLLTQTTTNVSNARYCNPDPSSYSNRLPLMQNAPQFYSSDPSGSHHTSALPFHESFSELPGQVVGATEKLSQPTKFCSKNQLSTPLNNILSVSHLHSRFRCLDPPQSSAHHLLPSCCRLPSTSPHQYSSMPRHHSCRLLPALHNTPPKRTASPCIYLQQ